MPDFEYVRNNLPHEVALGGGDSILANQIKLIDLSLPENGHLIFNGSLQLVDPTQVPPPPPPAAQPVPGLVLARETDLHQKILPNPPGERKVLLSGPAGTDPQWQDFVVSLLDLGFDPEEQSEADIAHAALVAQIETRQALSEKGLLNGYPGLDENALLNPQHVRPTDGARSIMDPRYGNGGASPASSPDDTLAAIMDAMAGCAADIAISGKACLQFGMGLYTITPGSFEPVAGLTIRGVPHATSLMSSLYETTSLFTTSATDWSMIDIILEGGRDLTSATGGPSIAVLNNAQRITFIGSVRNVMNNGFIIRGPFMDRCRFINQESYGSGLGITHGGGHMIAATGDGDDSPFDVTNCILRCTGWDIINGGINVGSTDKCYVEVIIWNDIDEVNGPPATGVAALRMANGSRSVKGYVIAHACGRALRIGPCDDVWLDVWAKHCGDEAVLLAGGPYDGFNWRGGGSRLNIKQINCNMLAGNDGTRAKSHGATSVKIDSINAPGSTALASTLTITPATDEDLADVRTVQGVGIFWDSLERMRFKIVDHPGDATQIDVTCVQETAGTDIVLATFTCGQNNDQFVPALMASAWPVLAMNGRAHVWNGNGLVMQRSTNGRSGPMDHRLRVGDIAAFLASPLNAGEITSTLTLAGDQSQDSPTSVMDDPSGEALYPNIAEIRDSAGTRREMVRVDSRLNRRLSITGGPSGGNVTLEVNREPVVIPSNATAAAVSALLLATRAGAAGVAVAGGPLPGTPITFSFTAPFVSVRRSAVALTGGALPAAQLGSPTFTIQRAQKGTPSLAWDPAAGAIAYFHLSEIHDLGGISDHMGLDAFSATGPATFCRIDYNQLKTDESNIRGVTGGLLNATLGNRVIHVTTPGRIDWITGRWAGRPLRIVADVDGVILGHGTGNIKLAGQRDLPLYTGMAVEVVCDDNGDQFGEVGVNVRASRSINLGAVGAAPAALTFLPGETDLVVRLSIAADTTLPIVPPSDRDVSILFVVTRTVANAALFFSPTAKKANNNAALLYTTGIGTEDHVAYYSVAGQPYALLVGPRMA